MPILRSATIGVLLVLSCLIEVIFSTPVKPSMPKKLPAATSRTGENLAQESTCKTVVFTLRKIIYADVVQAPSASTQSCSKTYAEVTGSSSSRSKPKTYGDSFKGSASSSKPKTYADLFKSSASCAASSSPPNAKPGPTVPKPSNPSICAEACYKEVWQHRDSLAQRPDFCQVVISNYFSPAYTNPGRTPSIYDWVYSDIQSQDLSLTSDCLPTCVIKALTSHPGGATGGQRNRACQNVCASPAFPDHRQCVCKVDLRVRRLLPETVQPQQAGSHGSFDNPHTAPCHESEVSQRLSFDGWQGQGYRIAAMRPCLQKDDADWVPDTSKDIVICYFKEYQHRATSSTLASNFRIWGAEHSEASSWL